MRQARMVSFQNFVLAVLQLLVICGAVISEVKLFKYHIAVISTKCCDVLFGFIWEMIRKNTSSVFQLHWDTC